MFKIDRLKVFSILSLSLLSTSVISSSALADNDNLDLFPTGEHEGGGTRGSTASCAVEVEAEPVSLIPKNTRVLTVSSSPQLLFHVPDVVAASALDLILLDEDNQVVYQDEFVPGYKPGIASVNLVDQTNFDTLKIDRLYHWYLVRDCEDIPTPKIVTNGSLQRIELDSALAKQLKDASTNERIKLYQEADIWHEAIANLAQLQCNLSADKFSDRLKMQSEDLNNYAQLLAQSDKNYCIDESNI